ncbi:orotidine-5'-phosphate decarboxylase [Ethanoligenens harbinense]|uniref:Orotidine 5'-phosphate decarboxylase n=1 Tax=Ethanoligenens harbinense (strain DSM 18485 / JCM 12961 / CGMCC 1.5033 / YUAN-3) TaxID=663278 RepID=E6U5D9_ETHHY|nr:orotidine-5'-phosphate decarboxylase [Ethanoligenens harbinense]ADU25606.1 orotidine 5'-phosphate decarboxylase [Ethanoligenens harbinense YUAN-3]
MDTLRKKIAARQNPTVAGLDPDFAKLPAFLREQAVARRGKTLEAAADAVLAFNRAIIDALCDVVPAVKPQAAYYELLGWPGVRALAETIAYAREKGLFVITDAKRGDIGSTMAAYARAHLGTVEIEGAEITPFGADALTVNAYLGSDGVLPALEVCKAHGKCIFVLGKTSNPSSGEIQDKLVDGEPVYSLLGHLCAHWSGMAAGGEPSGRYGTVGLVAGATYPAQLAELRQNLPHTFFLVPGYGAQGGGARDVAPAFDENGDGAIVNSSRAILYAWRKEGCNERDFAGAARREALRMKEDLNAVLADHSK